MKEILLVLPLILLCRLCNCYKNTPVGDLKKIILDPSRYDIDEWPHAAYKKSTTVEVQLFINSFGSLNAANMDFSLDAFLRQRWTDPRLIYNNSLIPSVTISEKSVQDKIWKPDTFFENVKEADLHQVTMPNVLLRISQNGDILYSIRVSGRFSINMDFMKYPFDSQISEVKIASYANTEDVIKYHWATKRPVGKPEDMKISQFVLLKSKPYSETYYYDTGNFSGLYVKFLLRRERGHHILQTYIPTIMIVSISWVSFWLDPNAVPGRVSLGVTTLLTLTTLASGIRQQLPPVSYVKAIDVWMGMCMIMVFGALLEFTIVNWLANRKVTPGKRPCTIPKCLLICSVGADAHEEDKENDPSKRTKETYMNHARAFDRVCRIFFPLSFLIFNVVYWPYYLSEEQTTVL